MKTNKEKFNQLNKDNQTQKDQTSASKGSLLVPPHSSNFRNTSQTQNFKGNYLKNSTSTIYKKADTLLSTTNMHEFDQNELGSTMKVSKQNFNNMKNDDSIFESKQITLTYSHQFDKAQKNTSKVVFQTLQQSTNHFGQIKVPELFNQGLLASNKKRTSICGQLQSKQLKSSKSAQLLHTKQSQIQTPTFQNINVIKANQKSKVESKGEKMKLRDYLFMTNISSEAVANKKRIERSNSRSNIVEPIQKGLKNCLSEANVMLKTSNISPKYAITNDQMATILSREILQEISRLKSKAQKVQNWLTSAPKSQINQIGPFYLVRRDIKHMNGNFDDILKKLVSSYPQFQRVENAKQMGESVAISKVVNNNLKFMKI